MVNTTYGRRFVPALGSFVDLGHPLARGLVGAWLFNEGAGPRIADSTGRRHYDGTVTGTTWVPGSRSSALLFNGSTDLVTIAQPADASLSGFSGLSMLGWIRPGVAQTGNLLNKDNNSAYRCRINNTRTLQVLVEGSNQITSTGTAPGDTWSHVAFTGDSIALLKIYINGKLDTSGGFNNFPIGDAGGPLLFGSGSFGEIYAGALNEFYLYNRALTAAEILWHYREPFTMYPTSNHRRWFFVVSASQERSPLVAAVTLTGQVPSRLNSGEVEATPTEASLSLSGSASLLNLTITPLVGALTLSGSAPQSPTLAITPTVGSLTLTGAPALLELSGENMLGLQWAVLHPADVLLAFQWVVLPQVVNGATLGLTWTVMQSAPPLGLTWEVMPEEIFELFESAGVGAAAGIGEDILLPVGRVSRA